MKLPEEHEFLPTFRYHPVTDPSSQDRRITEADLSDDQRVAFDELLRRLGYRQGDCTYIRPKGFISFGGIAGTGKSTLVPIISEALGDTSSTAFCAFTGKASNVLQRKLRSAGVDYPGYVGTIHRLLYHPLTNKEGRIVGWQRKDYPLFAEDHEIRRIIVDEASMVNTDTLRDLLSYDIPVLLVGDHGQLKPVQGVSVLEVPDICLEKIHRQAANNPIIKLASLIRETGNIPRDFQPSPQIQFVKKDEAYEIIGETYERLMLEMAVLVRYNAVRKRLNVEPRDVPEPVVGDMVICLKNVPPVFNGMRGLVEEISPYLEHWYKARIFFPDDGISIQGLLNRYQFGRDKTIGTAFDLQSEGVAYPRGLGELGLLFDFGMALTVHKAQGSAFKEVILIPDTSSYDKGDDYARWLYTAVTRASEKLTIVR